VSYFGVASLLWVCCHLVCCCGLTAAPLHGFTGTSCQKGTPLPCPLHHHHDRELKGMTHMWQQQQHELRRRYGPPACLGCCLLQDAYAGGALLMLSLQ
jgi:hypothetical protein